MDTGVQCCNFSLKGKLFNFINHCRPIVFLQKIRMIVQNNFSNINGFSLRNDRFHIKVMCWTHTLEVTGSKKSWLPNEQVRIFVFFLLF